MPALFIKQILAPSILMMSTLVCAGESIITIYERAMAQVWLKLEAIAQQHGVTDALQALVRVRYPLPPGITMAVSLNRICTHFFAPQLAWRLACPNWHAGP